MQFSSLAPYFLEEVPADTPPLFHYTDAGGLIGMVQHKKLWLTNIHYQNDNEEFYYAIKLGEEVLCENYPGLFSKGMFKNLVESLAPFFCFSLSEAKDSLSQWRGYAPDGGYAVSFSTGMLNATIKKEGLLIAKCIYDIEEQKKAIIEGIAGFTPEYYKELYENKGPWPKYFGNIQFYIAEKMMKFAPLLKHPSYAEEKEWRLIKDLTEYQSSNYRLPPHMFINNNSHEFKIRARKNLLIPYVEIPFNLRDGGYSNIKEITVGPTPHKERAAEACRILMANNEYIRIANVSNSAIPYINW